MARFAHLGHWSRLPNETKARLFGETARRAGLPSASAVEKDWWVVHTLSVIFSLGCASALVFKGGTSLSKGWNLIQRFSEDIDLALDREWLGFTGELSGSQIRKLRKKSHQFISKVFASELADKFASLGFGNVTVKCRETENHDQDPVVIEIYYDKLTEADVYLKPGVLVEVGGRSLKEPFTPRALGSFVAEIYPDSPFADPPIDIPVVNPERTFLEKVFLLHEEFQKTPDKIRVERLSRHLYDLEKLSQTEYAAIALRDMDLYNTIVAHRQKFNPVPGVDYAKHQPASIRFVPPGAVIKNWEADYREMASSMIYGPALGFPELMERLVGLQGRINGLG
jgi:predicted nucleotidyltransferase component of viral defense system